MNRTTTSLRGGSRPPLRILVVEHHSMLARCLRSYLEVIGHAVEVAPSMRAARDALRLRPFDVLLSDVCLPDGACYCLLQDGNPHLPPCVFTMSAFDAGCGLSELTSRVRRHLVKPFAVEELDSLLEEFASERALAKFHRAGSGC